MAAISEPGIGLMPIVARAAGRADNVFEGVGKFSEALSIGFDTGRDFARRRRTLDPYRAHMRPPPFPIRTGLELVDSYRRVLGLDID